MAWVLKEQGYEVSAAHGGQALLERLEHDAPPDLLLLDVTLPGADNYQTLERIKSDDRWRDLPILMVSALPPEEAAVRTLGLGAADFVRKPFRVRELLARIQAQLPRPRRAPVGPRGAEDDGTGASPGARGGREPAEAGATSSMKSRGTCRRTRSIIFWPGAWRVRLRCRTAR